MKQITDLYEDRTSRPSQRTDFNDSTVDEKVHGKISKIESIPDLQVQRSTLEARSHSESSSTSE